MGLTISDLHQLMYHKKRDSGMTHKEAINDFPKHVRKQVEHDLQLSPFQSHFGVTGWQFLILMIIVLVVTLALTLI